MNSTHTARFSIPLLAAGQAHKEVFHNEALTLLDFLVQPVVKAVENDPQSLVPLDGQCWLVGTTPLSDWTDRANQLACWTEGGWRYLEPVENTRIFVESVNGFSIFTNNGWQTSDLIASPGGGPTIDAEARFAIDSILDVLQSHGLTSA